MAALDTQPQHMQALAQANRVRLARAKVREEVKDGTRTVESVLGDVPELALGMTIGELLLAQRRWGKDKTRRLLGSLQIPESRTIGGDGRQALTPRQREEIIVRLRWP